MTTPVIPSALGDVSRETLDKLQNYAALLEKWSPRINLVSKSTLSDIWERHVVDSFQIVPHLPQDVNTIADLGSGGGLPALILSIGRPSATVTMIESDQRKCTFLRTCIRELELNARVITGRIEQAPPQNADIVTARALAPLPELLAYTARHLAPNGAALLMKGKSSQEELAEARKTWSFDVNMIPSQTNADAQILRIERIARA